MFLYKEYVKERLDANVIHNDKGFLQYQIDGDICYITELFIMKEFRSKGEAFDIVNLLVDILSALDVPKIKKIIATVHIDTNGYQRALYCALRYGFNIVKLDNNCIYLQKDL